MNRIKFVIIRYLKYKALLVFFSSQINRGNGTEKTADAQRTYNNVINIKMLKVADYCFENTFAF